MLLDGLLILAIFVVLFSWGKCRKIIKAAKSNLAKLFNALKNIK